MCDMLLSYLLHLFIETSRCRQILRKHVVLHWLGMSKVMQFVRKNLAIAIHRSLLKEIVGVNDLIQDQ